jgi:hypothetical protein
MAVIIDGTNGITSPEPFVLTSGTLSSPAVAGQTEYDGKVFYKTPQGTQRGVVPGAQFFRLDAALVGANVNTAQSVLGVGVTLSSSTVYEFELLYFFSKSAGTTSHTFGLGFGGTATLNNIAYSGYAGAFTSATPSGTDTSPRIFATNAATNFAISSAITSAAITNMTSVRGTVSVNAGGTLIPQYTLSAAPGGAYSTQTGSYFLIYPIGASGANISVGTWA